jgi:hypothetical protein
VPSCFVVLISHPAGRGKAPPVIRVSELLQATRAVAGCSQKFANPVARALTRCGLVVVVLLLGSALGAFKLCDCCVRSGGGGGGDGGGLVERVILGLHCMCKGCGSDKHGVAAGQGQGPSEGHQVLGKGCNWTTSCKDGCSRTAGKKCRSCCSECL